MDSVWARHKSFGGMRPNSNVLAMSSAHPATTAGHGPGHAASTGRIDFTTADLHKALVPPNHHYSTGAASQGNGVQIFVAVHMTSPMPHTLTMPLVDVSRVNTRGGKLFASTLVTGGEVEVASVEQHFAGVGNSGKKVTLSAHDVLVALGHHPGGSAAPAGGLPIALHPSASAPATPSGSAASSATPTAHDEPAAPPPPLPNDAPRTTKKGYAPDTFVDDPMDVVRRMLRGG